MEPLRIAQVCPPWLSVPPKGYGGIEWVVGLLSDGLVKAGHEVTLFATGDSHTLANLEYVFEQAPGTSKINDVILDTTHTLFATRNARERFDILHIHSPFSALAAAIQTGVPTVHTLHGSFTTEMRRLYGLIRDRAWFVAISQAQRRSDNRLTYAGIVYNGVDTELYALREKKDDFVLFLGRAAPEKGWLRAIQAAELAGVRLVSAVKIAQAEEEEEWNERIRPALSRDAEVLGEVSQEAKIDLLQRARALLFPIDWDEPFGLVMTEAMSCGTPVIATPRGSVPEVVEEGETGFVVSVERFPEEAAERIGRLDSISPASCRARVDELFSKEAMVAGYESVYAEVSKR
jgi:glycosyltransferase involved in cell wall biosynthesis